MTCHVVIYAMAGVALWRGSQRHFDFHSTTFQLNVSPFGGLQCVVPVVSVTKTAQVEVKSGHCFPNIANIAACTPRRRLISNVCLLLILSYAHARRLNVYLNYVITRSSSIRYTRQVIFSRRVLSAPPRGPRPARPPRQTRQTRRLARRARWSSMRLSAPPRPRPPRRPRGRRHPHHLGPRNRRVRRRRQAARHRRLMCAGCSSPRARRRRRSCCGGASAGAPPPPPPASRGCCTSTW